jgi:hypothetical protein
VVSVVVRCLLVLEYVGTGTVDVCWYGSRVYWSMYVGTVVDVC